LALIGDDRPLILDWIDRANPSSVNGIKVRLWLRSIAACLVKKDHYLVPAAWVLLAGNGFSLAASALAKSINIAHSHKALLETSQQIPEFVQGIAILIGCLCLAANQYLNRVNAKTLLRSDEERVIIAARADALGSLAVSLLTSCTMLTMATGVADLSPSLLLCSSPAFLLGNYCQDNMRRSSLAGAVAAE
jgi:hypothetical protein